MAQTRDIKYVNRDFSNLRNQLIEFSKNYFSDTYNDFSPTSPGIMFIEMAAYVGDVLSFYQDTQIQETFVQYAKDPKNLINLAYMMGYRPKITSVSEVDLEISQIVSPNTGNNFLPDWTQATTILENAQFQSTTSDRTVFYTNEPVDFSYSSSFSPTEVLVEEYDNLGVPVLFRLKKSVKAYSGDIKTTTRTFTTAEKFTTILIDDTNIIGIKSIVDNDGAGDTWYEVPYLGQETVFVEERNTNSDSNIVYNKLTLRKVDKRFVTRFDSLGRLQIQFGAGTLPQDDTDFIPTLENVGLGTNTGISRLDYAYDPSNFLYTRTYGLAPTNTTLRIEYLVGGGVTSNAPANSITGIKSATAVGGDPNALDNIEVNNPLTATGGSDQDTVDEIRQNSLRAFNEQGRVVTLQDFLVRSYSLPRTLGSLAKVYATQDQLSSTLSTQDIIIDSNPLSISLYTLAYDQNRKLVQPSLTLKDNLKTYLSQYIMLTDAVNIKDAYVINIGVEYEILIYPNEIGREVLLRCKNELIDYFDISKWNINQPINLSDIYMLLDRVKGVQTVQNVRILNKVGGEYSQYAYDITSATKGNIVFPSLDPCIFEVKFPNDDIKGRITVG
jgi:hypothetical protein